MMKRVVKVEPLGGHRLRLSFDDGVEGILDFDRFFEFVGVFEPHRDPAFFAKAFVDGSTVAWPNDTDLDPVVLYARVTGRDPLEVLRDRGSAPRRRRSAPATRRRPRGVAGRRARR